MSQPIFVPQESEDTPLPCTPGPTHCSIHDVSDK